MSVEEFAKQLDMFRKGFEAVTKNIESQLVKVNEEVERLVKNTAFLPKIKKDNEEIMKKLMSLSGILGELIRRLDLMEMK